MSGFKIPTPQSIAALVFGFLAVFGGNFGQSFFVGFFGEEIQQSLDLSASAYSSAYSLATLVSAITVIWLGGLIDRISLQKYIFFTAVGLTLATVIVSQATNLIVLTVGLYLLRLFGQALLPHAGATTMARAFDTHRGKALSIASSGFPAGEIVLPILAVSFISAFGWRWTYLSIAIFIVFILLPILIWLVQFSGLNRFNPNIETPQNIDGGEKKKTGVRGALLRDFRYWLALPGLMAGPFVATGIFIHQDYIVTTKDWTATLLATSFVTYGVVHWLSSLASGVLVDRFSAVKLLPFFSIPLLIALIFVAFVPGWWVAIIMMVFMGMTIGLSPPITGSLWPEMYGTANIGVIRSINVAIMVFATSLSPILFGVLIDLDISLSYILGGCSVYVALSSILLVFSYYRYPYKHQIASKS
ncbi:MAG: MFS transporter [Cellvibrionaceae bacterium]